MKRVKRLVDRTTRITVSFSAILFACTYGIALADSPQSENSRSLIQLSFQELLSVSVTSKRIERIVDTPGVVSILNVNDLTRLGLYSLSDIIRFLPGGEVNEMLSGNKPIQIRGLSDTFNQKVLFLLDGVPYWMPASGDLPLNGIPFSSIDKVEVIRGPGSVLYGSNASGGVINVITRKDTPSTIDARVSEYGIQNFGGFLNFSEGDFHIQSAGEHQSDEGYQAHAVGVYSPFNYHFQLWESDWYLYSDRNHFYQDVPIKNINGIYDLPGDGEIYFDSDGEDNIRWRSGTYVFE